VVKVINCYFLILCVMYGWLMMETIDPNNDDDVMVIVAMSTRSEEY